MLKLRPNGIFALAFFGAYRLCRQFAGDNYVDIPARTDFCTFVRTILIAAPLAVGINLAVLGLVLFSLAYLGHALWLNLTEAGWFLLVIASIVGGIAACIAFWLGMGRLGRAIATSETVREAERVIAAYYRAKKESICPIVDLRGGLDEVA